MKMEENAISNIPYLPSYFCLLKDEEDSEFRR